MLYEQYIDDVYKDLYLFNKKSDDEEVDKEDAASNISDESVDFTDSSHANLLNNTYHFSIATSNDSIHVYRHSSTILEDSDQSTILEPDEVTFHPDAVLVYNTKVLEDPKKKKCLIRFIENIDKIGLEVEIVKHSEDPTIIFVLICARDDIIIHYAQLFEIDLCFRIMDRQPRKSQIWPTFLKTDLHDPHNNPELFERGRAILYEYRARKILTKERILIIHYLLQRLEFDDDECDVGISRLMSKRIVSDYFPLHEGDYEWTYSGPLNGRQILSKYWASFSCFFKLQPIDVIQRYSGTEEALYFGLMGLYNRMLLFSSFISIIFIIINAIYCSFSNEWKEYCQSDLPLCPRCTRPCPVKTIKQFCFNAVITCLLDTPFTPIYAIFTCCWAAIFIKLWTRKEITYQFRWNKMFAKVHNKMRIEFALSTHKRKVSPYTGKLEPYYPLYKRLFFLIVTFVAITVMVFTVLFVLFIMILWKRWRTIEIDDTIEQEQRYIYSMWSLTYTSSVMSLFVVICELAYDKISLILTKLENPRTQLEFDNSYIYKRFLLYGVVMFIPLFYIAFIKGKLYVYPGLQTLPNSIFNVIQQDQCELPNCVLELAVQVLFLVFFRSFALQIFNFARSYFMCKLWPKLKGKTRWEKDYVLVNAPDYYMIDDYMRTVTQFAFVTFFSTIFPLAPLLSLIANLCEIRVDAIKFNRYYRRSIPKYVSSIGGWYGIFEIIFYISIVVNAFVIVYTTQSVYRITYAFTGSLSLKGFVLYMMSAFDVDDFHAKRKPVNFTGICYYHGFRYGPAHPKKYKSTIMFWKYYIIQAIFVLVFEALMLTFSQILKKYINITPSFVLDKINAEQTELEEMRWKNFSHDENAKIKREMSKYVSQEESQEPVMYEEHNPDWENNF